MAPIPITREEYQKKFGVAPDVPVQTIKAPIPITHEQYMAKFGPSPESIAIDRNREVGGETALISTKPAPQTGLGLADALKTIPNAAKDVFDMVKGATWDTGKRIIHDIPEEAKGLLEDTGGNPMKAIGSFLSSVPEATLKTIWGLVPQSAKEITNTNALADIPKEFTNLVKESGGYANAFLNLAKSIPESITPAMSNYVDQLDKARQSFENHPVNEALGYFGLKSLGKNPASFAKNPVMATAEEAANATKATAETAGQMYDAITTINPAKIDSFITKKFEQGVRPSVSGKKTSGQLDQYQDKAINAVKTIVENKPNLKITNEYGEVTGELPRSLGEFSQAIEQTKKNVFNEYDSMAKAAGDTGAKVELTPIVKELNTIRENPVMQDLHPNVIRYAEARMRALQSRGAYSTSQAQDAVQSLNKSLEAFYKNPTYETASRASVDAMIANQLRTGLDNSITALKGEGYQALKNKYGALKTIEKDVLNRTIVDGRKNAKGLIDFSDILSAGEVIKGLSATNPASLITGAAMKGISMYYKYLNNPNTAISRLFKGVEKSIGGGSQSKAL